MSAYTEKSNLLAKQRFYEEMVPAQSVEKSSLSDQIRQAATRTAPINTEKEPRNTKKTDREVAPWRTTVGTRCVLPARRSL